MRWEEEDTERLMVRRKGDGRLKVEIVQGSQAGDRRWSGTARKATPRLPPLLPASLDSHAMTLHHKYHGNAERVVIKDID